MKFKVRTAIRNHAFDIIFEAADLNTCKMAVAQWVARERRNRGLTHDEFVILEISEIN